MELKRLKDTILRKSFPVGMNYSAHPKMQKITIEDGFNSKFC